MNCLNKKCTISDHNERMMSCWLCHGLMHFKCSGLPTLAAEASQKYDGLHWCCIYCRKIGVDFYKFFQNRKSAFIQIEKELSELSNRVSDYGKIFDDYKLLDNLQSPPQSSPKRRKSSRIPDKTIAVESPGAASVSNNNSEFDTPVNLNQNSTSNNKTKKVKSKTVSIQPSAVLNNDTNNQTHRELRIIPPKRSIFISRCASETTVEDIDYYIKTKLDSNSDSNAVFLIHKFLYSQPRSITSFKITPPSDVFDQIFNPCFWPDNTLVREYVYKENQRTNNSVRFPSVSSNQKN